ncbi:hypothetical protein KUTeg_003287, partial [Tegillarca granosa]
MNAYKSKFNFRFKHIVCGTAHPINCDFEHGICGVANDWTDDMEWVRKSGPVSATGPLSDHSNGN